MRTIATKYDSTRASGSNAVLLKHPLYIMPLMILATLIAVIGYGTMAGTVASASSASESSDVAAQSCTLYVAANGSTNNHGATPTSATTLREAAQVATAGDVVCLEPGTYSLTSTIYFSHSGNSSAWITFMAYDTGAVNIVWTGGTNTADHNMFHIYGSKFPNGPSYIEFEGLTLNGQNAAYNGFFCQGSHHVRYLQNMVENMGASGIGSSNCDYQTADHNLVYHNGYTVGYDSGISFDSNQWFDRYAGLHNIVSNNIVAGSYDGSSHHSDGNGIIMDTSNGTANVSSANTPETLIVNNVVYGNGGRCIQNDFVTNIWVINNTCYDNGLDTSLGHVGGIDSRSASHQFFVNNLVESWDNDPPFMEYGTGNNNIVFSHNLIYGGTNYGFTDTSSEDFIVANPDFVKPPAYNATAGGQYADTINPSLLGTVLNLKSDSPAIGRGIDPISLAGSNSSLKSDLSAYIYKDINGIARPEGGPFVLGAYQQ